MKWLGIAADWLLNAISPLDDAIWRHLAMSEDCEDAEV